MSRWTRSCEPLNQCEVFEYRHSVCSPGVCDIKAIVPIWAVKFDSSFNGRRIVWSPNSTWPNVGLAASDCDTYLLHCRHATKFPYLRDLLPRHACQYLRAQNLEFIECNAGKSVRRLCAKFHKMTYLGLVVRIRPSAHRTAQFGSGLFRRTHENRKKKCLICCQIDAKYPMN